MKSIGKIVYLLILLNLIVSGQTLPEQDDFVYVLNSKNFDDFVNNNEFTVVFFYAPWCGHCTNMKPFYHEVAKLLQEDTSIKSDKPVHLAKVDATVDSDLAARFQIQGYPTLKIIRKGQAYDYDGPRREAKDIINYLIPEASNNWKPPVSKVDVLVNSNFTEWVDKYEISLVEFYSPNCGHCIRLAPNYEKAAKILSEESNPIPLSKVDASQERELSEKYSINGYPTLLVFRKGRHYEYKGGREVHEIVSTMKKLATAGSIEVKTFNAFTSKVNLPTDIHVLGFFESKNDKNYEVFNHFASKYSEDAKIFHTFDKQEFLKYIKSDKIKKTNVIVFYHDLAVCKNEPKFATLNKDAFSVEDLEEFVFRSSLPLVGHLSPKNKRVIFENIRPLCYVFYDVDRELKSHVIYIRDKVATIAKKFKNIKFVLANETENFDLIRQFHLEDSQSETSVVCLNEKSKFFIYDEDNDSFDEDEIIDFVKKFTQGKLTPYIKSEPVLKENEKKNLKKLVGKNIENFLATSNNILLGIVGQNSYENINQFESNLAKLANKFASNKNLSFGKINMFLNDIPEIFNPNPKQPSLYFVPVNDKSKPILFTKSASFDEMLEFVEENLLLLKMSKSDKSDL
ncbi:unnamed protein product [Brachionus calyciflorus]|uniref:Thioredoxin domain-containing protein n=1 Tax=Brachionus calyciflorus TaxID=104777 RepID=A0A813SBK7_9BILA|nr:unnamed protein product [Brachionus calyciflorus]